MTSLMRKSNHDSMTEESISRYALKTMMETILLHVKDIKYDLAEQRAILQDHAQKIESLNRVVEQTHAKQHNMMQDLRKMTLETTKVKDTMTDIHNTVQCIQHCMNNVESPSGMQYSLDHQDHSQQQFEERAQDAFVSSEEAVPQFKPEVFTIDDSPQDIESSRSPLSFSSFFSRKRPRLLAERSAIQILVKAKQSKEFVDLFGMNHVTPEMTVSLFHPPSPTQTLDVAINKMAHKVIHGWCQAYPDIKPPPASWYANCKDESGVNYSLTDRMVEQVSHFFQIEGLVNKGYAFQGIKYRVQKALGNGRTTWTSRMVRTEMLRNGNGSLCSEGQQDL